MGGNATSSNSGQWFVDGDMFVGGTFTTVGAVTVFGKLTVGGTIGWSIQGPNSIIIHGNFCLVRWLGQGVLVPI